LYKTSHEHEPQTLGETLKEQRGGLSLAEQRQQHFAEGQKSDQDQTEGYAGGGLIRASKGEYLVSADGSNLGAAIRHFTGYADGGLIDESMLGARAAAQQMSSRTSAMMPGSDMDIQIKAANMANSFAAGVARMESMKPGPMVASPGAMSGKGEGPGPSLAGYHQLDIRTSAGTFPTAVTGDTMQALQASSLASKISATGQRPSWFS
jgi:hypothetical protein